MKKRIYFDNSATTPVREEVLDSMLPYFTTNFGNPSSPYKEGQIARQAVDKARLTISKYFNTLPQEIIFTSGGTESNNWVIRSGGKDTSKRHIITSQIEHSSTLKALKSSQFDQGSVTYIKVDSSGHINSEDIKKAITNDTALVTLTYANSELGTIFEIEEIGRICKEFNVPLHIDALQAAKYLPIDVERLNISYLSVAAHKIYGPKGIGMLYVKKGEKLDPYISGGSQEYDLRAGTENVPGIVGFGKAVELLSNERIEREKKTKKLRDYFEELLIKTIDDIHLNGGDPRLCSISNVTFNNVPSDSLIFHLDSEGISVSAGSACTSGSILPSEILLAIGLTEKQARETIRFSFCENNTMQEIDTSIKVLKNAVNLIRMV